MHRPGALVLCSSRAPLRRLIQPQTTCSCPKWFSRNQSRLDSSSRSTPNAEASNEPAKASENNVNNSPIPRRVYTPQREHANESQSRPELEVDTNSFSKKYGRKDIKTWQRERSHLLLKGLVRDIGQSSASVRLPWTQKIKTRPRLTNVYYVQLRDGCNCPRCVDPKTKQRLFRSSDIPSKIIPRQMRWIDDSDVDEEKVLEILWDNDVPGFDSSHVTRVTADELRFPASYYFNKETHGKPRMLWNKTEMERAQHWVSYKDYIEDDEKFATALKQLSRFGLLFIKDIPDSREMVANIATRIGPLRNSFYGETWDVRNDPEAKNVAYTNQNLGFHMDLLYMREPPGYQLLHCLKNSCEGGESLFVDAFSAARDLDQSTWEVLSRYQVPYHYDHEDHYYRAMRTVIETGDLAKVPDGAATRWIAHINYSPPFQGPWMISERNMRRWGLRAETFISAFKVFADKIEEPERIFELKLNPGECVIFENRRVLHARRAFDTSSGERWLAGAYIDEDAVNSKMFTMKRKAGAFVGPTHEATI